MGFGGGAGAVKRHSGLIARARRAAELSVKQQITMRSKPARAACATVLTAIAAARSARIRRRPRAVFLLDFERAAIAGGEGSVLAIGVAPLDRYGGMNDVARAQAVARYNFGIRTAGTAFGDIICGQRTLRGGFGQAGSFGHRAATSTPKMLGGPSASSKTRPI